MLSPFLKKLIFVRQFLISDGKIEILGEKQVMMPLSAVSHLYTTKNFVKVSDEIRKSMEYYAKHIGTSSGGMIKSVQDIYETMGLGKMQIIKLDSKKKATILRLQNINVANTGFIASVLCGLFSFMFNKNLKQSNISVKKKSGYLEVSIK